MTRRQEWGALAALVLVSTALRTWAALEVPVPWIAPDEMVYGLLGRSLYLHGSLTILGGPTAYYSFLTPVLAGFPLSAFGLHTGYDVLKGLQGFTMSLAAVPVYLWSRSLVSRRSAFLAAALTVAIPGLAYSGLVMTEVLFYPLLAVAAWAGAEAIAGPKLRTQGLLVLAVLAASATRVQAIVLLPALATAVLVDAALARSWTKVRRLWPAASGLALLVAGWLAWRLGSGSGTLGGYEVVASTSYSVGQAAHYVLYHAASLLILCGLFPVAGIVLLLIHGLRRSEPDPRVRAYLAVAFSFSAWLVVEVGVFASRYSDRIVERNLIGLAPVLFVGLVVWLERGPVGGYVERSAVGLGAAAILLLLPVKTFVNVFGTHDAMTLIPLYRLSTSTSLDTAAQVYAAVAGALALVVAFAPRRQLRLAMPVVLVVAFALASVVSSRFVAQQARAQQLSFLGPDPSWADDAGAKRAAYLYDGETSWPGVWETLFWNARVDRVYDLGDVQVPGPIPQTQIEVQEDGSVTGLPAGRKKAKYAVASTWIELAGRRVAQVAQQGLTQAGLTLWKLDGTLRVRSRFFGLQPNGDIYGPTTGTLVAYDCGTGAFRITLIVKQEESVEIRLDGKVVRRLQFSSPTTVHLDFPLDHRVGACRLDVTPTGLLGTTVFMFDRS